MSRERLDLSVVIPVYTDIESLPILCDEFEEHVQPGTSYEIIFVNDGNVANAVYEALNELKSRKGVRVLHLSRNFGQHAAIAAGLKNARGEYLIVMDSDLQYLPKDCLRMVEKARAEKLGAVLSLIRTREHSVFKVVTSKMFHWLMRSLGVPQEPNMGSAFVVSRHVAQGLSRMGDRQRHTIPMVLWLCGEIGYLEIPHHPRPFGKSGYNLEKLIAHAIRGITSFSATPLYISLLLSSLFSLVALMFGLYLVVKILFFGATFLAGWASTVVLVLFCSGVILGCLGIIGLYLARVFEFTKARPLYYVQSDSAEETLLFEDREP